MTEHWFIQDIDKLVQHRNRVVVIDPTAQCSFLIDMLEKENYRILRTEASITEQWRREWNELMLRHEAETTYHGQKVVFYATQPLEKLSFLFDYCFTHGCLDLTLPQAWLKKKIFSSCGLQVHLDNPLLITAAKMSIGKDINWWKKIVQNLEQVIDLDKELLPFIDDPNAYMQSKEEDVRRLFEDKIHELLGQPYVSKLPKTLADEIVKRMLDGIANNELSPTLQSLYHKWADSARYRPKLETYAKNYTISKTANPWIAYPDHCFEKLDLIALRQITGNLRDRNFVNEKLQKLKPRIISPNSQLFVPAWWQDVITLLDTKTEALAGCKTLNDVIEYYTAVFSKVDRAIRNLYANFLNEGAIIRPLQEHYDALNHILLDTWFSFLDQYKSDQQGFIPELLIKEKGRVAVIVGDGVRYEIADFIACELQKHLQVEKQIMMADMPSETEHNMSALYVGGNEVIAKQKDREALLIKNTKKDILYMQLEQLNYGVNADSLVLTYKDIDSAGEKFQHAAIKLFSEFETVLIEKIQLLLNIGYACVYLITDHGFVLTGLLDEADKIDPSAEGNKEVHERFIRTKDKQHRSDWIEFSVKYDQFNYVYAARSSRPFKSKGVYGFSHGGFTPQEIIIPKFKFTRKKSDASQLVVFIDNKKELEEVPGELFVIRIDAPHNPSDLFDVARKVQIKLYAGNKEYQSSDIISVESSSAVDKEFSFAGNSQVTAVLVDAITLEQLDSAVVKKSNLRDLGGLM